MLWLSRPPVLRWLGAGCLVLVAAWSEFSPPPTMTATFLITDVAVGTPLAPEHVEERTVPATMDLETIEPAGFATTDLTSGDPLLASMATEVSTPAGWMVIEAPVPAHARPGNEATGVILDDGSAPIEFAALVMETGGSDPFGGSIGTLAVPPEWMAAAAAAAAGGRLVVGVEAAGR